MATGENELNRANELTKAIMSNNAKSDEANAIVTSSLIASLSGLLLESDVLEEMANALGDKLGIDVLSKLGQDDTTNVNTNVTKDITEISYGDQFQQPNVLDPNVVPDLAGTENQSYEDAVEKK